MYQSTAIDADGDIWGQKTDSTWVLMIAAEAPTMSRDRIEDVSIDFGPVAVALLVPVNE